MDRVPFAASVRNPGPEPYRVESFDLADAEDPTRFPQSVADEEARQVRLSAPPASKPEVSAEERARLVAGCADAVAAWSGIYGGADLAIRALVDAIGSSVGEAERLLTAELARRSKG